MMVQMEKLAEQCDMELMKAAMLKHEETFRQQVHDLHRLYRVQKQLMSDITRGLPRQQGQRRRQHSRRPELNLQHPVDEHIVVRGTGTGRQVTPPSTESEDELQLTLALGGDGSSRSQKTKGVLCSHRKQTASSLPFVRFYQIRVSTSMNVRQLEAMKW
uniref:Uncharacterized protein n=2 Tax=Avena sativa TaxID=4498 RepID=A0ACD6A5B2_AVESA